MGFLRPRMVAPSSLSNHGIPCRCNSRLRRLPRGKDVLFRALGISVCGQHYLFLKKKLTWLHWVVVVAHGILVARPGIKPVSPALEEGFLTTGPSGKSLAILL